VEVRHPPRDADRDRPLQPRVQRRRRPRRRVGVEAAAATAAERRPAVARRGAVGGGADRLRAARRVDDAVQAAAPHVLLNNAELGRRAKADEQDQIGVAHAREHDHLADKALDGAGVVRQEALDGDDGALAVDGGVGGWWLGGGGYGGWWLGSAGASS
jgi:hypothetical protein